MATSVGELQQQANRLLREGRIAEAIEAHRQLLALRPDLADGWYNLAYLQRCDRQFEDALESYQNAVAHGVRQPEDVHVNRAVILSEHLDRVDDARMELEKALSLNPHFVIAWLNLGNLHEDAGNAGAARAAYENVLKLMPQNGRALARIAAIEIFEGRADAMLPRLQQALQMPGLDKEDAAELAFGIANALDASGAYDRAFEMFVTANRLAGELAHPSLRYDPAAQEQLIDRIISAFPNPVEPENTTDPTPPIFICGMFRSGSTLAEQIFARHSRVTPGGELEFLPALVSKHLQPFPEAAGTAPASLIEEIRRTYVDGIRKLHPNADMLTDKRPDNFLYIGLIKRMFPHAKIVYTRRNALDNILSIFFLYFDQSVHYGHSIADTAHWYKQHQRLMNHWTSLYPEDIHVLDYDSTVTNPRLAIAELLRFCGLKWEDGCLSADRAENAVRTPSAWQVRQPLYTRSSGRWRNYERHIGGVAGALNIPIDR